MPNVWNLGNTTVRNPNRIELGLRLFAEEFQGTIQGTQAEAQFARRLSEEGIVESDGNNNDWFGRKWRSVLVKLGFATDKNYKIGKESFPVGYLAEKRPELKLKGLEYELTPIGKRLMEAKSTGEIQDIFLRQLTCLEIPSPLPAEGKFPEGHLKPFIYLLQVLSKLRELGEEGLNKVETAIFLQLFVDHNDKTVDEKVRQLLEFRKKRNEFDSNMEKLKFERVKLDESASLGNVTHETLLDYADTTFRYSKMTGLIVQLGSRLVFRDNKIAISKELLLKEPLFLANKDPFGYLANFYSGVSLPTDNVTFALIEIKRLFNELKKYDKVSSIDINNLSEKLIFQEIESARYELIEQLSWAREEQFANEQMKDVSLHEIINYLDALESKKKSNLMGIPDRPAYLEWAVWRSFLAIDHITNPIHLTRRFPVDEDLLPRHTAPGGGSDSIFEFEDFVLLVEVTLSTSSRQAATEGEPVQRHVAEAKAKYSSKDVYGIFIAPTIDNNTAESFRYGTWYQGDKDYYVNIVPLTLEQFRQMMKILFKIRYTPKIMQKLMDRCLTYRNAKAPEWKLKIEDEMNRWLIQFEK